VRLGREAVSLICRKKEKRGRLAGLFGGRTRGKRKRGCRDVVVTGRGWSFNL